MQTSLPVAPRPRRPEWMKVRAPSADSRYFEVRELLHGQRLNTICEEARCPNIAECWGRGTATFQILGDTCTRACRYCYVHSGKPDGPPDPLEPLRLAQTARQMRLHPRMRGAKASYEKALWLLARAKEVADYPVLSKSGIIVGLGETNDEVVETMHDLREHRIDVVTIGQYLQPSSKHVNIDRWVHPDEFRWFREQGEALGFGSVFSGPLVRSSYRADEQRHAAATKRGAVAY